MEDIKQTMNQVSNFQSYKKKKDYLNELRNNPDSVIIENDVSDCFVGKTAKYMIPYSHLCSLLFNKNTTVVVDGIKKYLEVGQGLENIEQLKKSMGFGDKRFKDSISLLAEMGVFKFEKIKNLLFFQINFENRKTATEALEVLKGKK